MLKWLLRKGASPFDDILRGAIEGAVAAAIRKPGNINASTIAADAVKKVTADPKVVNEISAEKPYQSRVTIGVTAMAGTPFVPNAVIPPIIGLLNATGLVTIDADMTALIVSGAEHAMGLWGFLYAIYGRYWPGLKPLFSG